MSSIDPTGGVKIGNMMPGLVSGLDTESMVEKMLSGTQAKIDKQNAQKQIVTWKQEIYRDIITKLDNFRSNYFTYTGKNNLLSNTFFNTMSSVSSSSAVKVISSSTKAQSNITIDSITRLATAYQEKSADTVMKDLEGTADFAQLQDNREYSIDINLDGVKRTVKFQGDPDKTKVIDNINESLGLIWGNTVKFQLSAGDKVSVITDNSHNVMLTNTGDDDILGALGFEEEASNKLNYNASLKNSTFKVGLIGDEFEFVINGATIKARAAESVSDVISRINNSDAGVKVTYSAVEDKFTMTSKLTGEVDGFEIKQTKGNLLTALFGTGNGDGISHSTTDLKNGDTITAAAPVNDSLLTAIIDATNSGGGQYFKVKVNGYSYNIGVPAPGSGDAPYTKDTYIDAINNQLEARFGAGNIVLSLDSGTNTMSLKTAPEYKAAFGDDDIIHNMNDAFGFTAVADQIVTGSSVIGNIGLGGTLSVNGTSFSLNPSWTMDDLVTNYNALGVGTMVFDETEGRVSITGISGNNVVISGSDAAGTKSLKTLFGVEQATFNTADQGIVKVQGQNAKLTVNGIDIERNSNEFELEGVTIQLMGTSADSISLTTERDVDKIEDGIKEFVEEYNNIIEELNGYLTEDPNYRKYAPLTDEQKKDMSEKEIEKWEEKAKQGLLRNDYSLEAAVSEMRAVMYQTVSGAGIALYDIGIEALSGYKENGKLTIDEAKLRAAITNDPDKVQQLFMDKTEGVGVKLSTILKETAYVSSGSPGILVQYAGTKTTLTTENTLSDELKGINDRIKLLNQKYTTERARYWQQFTQMEKALSQLNTQSSWIGQQFGGSSS